MSNRPWLRQVEVVIGSIPDWKTDPLFSGPPSPIAVKVYSDGTQNTLRVKFSVNKHIVSTSSPTLIQIYNLGPDLRAALLTSSGTKEMRGAQVRLSVGWLNGDSGGLNTQLQPIFIGGLWAAWSRREGADIVTNLSCLADLPAHRGTVQKTVPRHYSVRDLVLELARMIPGVTVDPLLVTIPIVTSVGSRGMSLSGMIKDNLNTLSRTYGFSWHILDGVFEASNDGDDQAFMGTVVQVNPYNGFLQRAEPMLASPWQQQVGISISSLLHPLIQPGRVVELESTVNPRLNGSYMAQTVTHNGDTHSGSWDTNIESFLITRFTTKPTGVHSVDAKGMSFLAQQEGNILKKHLVDGIPHIGVGHRLTDQELATNKIRINGMMVDYSNGITAQQSLNLQRQDVVWVENTLNSSAKVPLNQSQFNALASVTYNVGSQGFSGSSLAKTLNAGNYAKVGTDLLTFKITSQGTGAVSDTLIARRKQEAALWNTNG